MGIRNAERIDSTLQQPTPISVQVDKFVKSPLFRSYSPNTHQAYIPALISLMEHCLNKNVLDPSLITHDFINDWRDMLDRQANARTTTRTRLNAARSFRNWYEKETQDQSDPNLTRVLDENQTKKLFQNVTNPGDAAFLLISLNTGALIEEIIRLNNEDIEITETGDYLLFLKGLPRGNPMTKPRVIPIGKDVGKYIKLHANGLEKSHESHPLFRGKNRLRMSEEEAQEMIRILGSSIGIDDLNFTALRNTFIANFQGSKDELAEILG